MLAGTLNDFAIRHELLSLPPSIRSDSLLLPEISDLPNDLIPRGLLGWIPDIKRFLGKSPFENNVFIMVAYRQRLEPLIAAVKGSVKDLGLNPVMAREITLTDNLDNPIACLLCCKYGIAIFDRGELGQTHNANVVYELAVMQTFKRPCLLLKSNALPRMPTDFLHRLYQPYRTTNDAATKVRDWWTSINKI